MKKYLTQFVKWILVEELNFNNDIIKKHTECISENAADVELIAQQFYPQIISPLEKLYEFAEKHELRLDNAERYISRIHESIVDSLVEYDDKIEQHGQAILELLSDSIPKTKVSKKK